MTIILITIKIDAEINSIYENCGQNENNYCFGSKSSSENGPENNPAFNLNGCIKDRACYMIVHGIRSGSNVDWYIASIRDHWNYVGFSKNEWTFNRRGVPQNVPLMEVWDSYVSIKNGS